MRLFPSFRVRSRERDDATDRARFERLSGQIDGLAAEIETERAGLARRYEEATGDAGFAQAVYEDGRAGERTSKRIDDLTQDIMRCQERLAELERQAVMLRRLKADVETFREG